MNKFLSIFLIPCILLGAFSFGFLDEKKAFVPHIKVDKSSNITIKIDLAKDIYIYKNSIKIDIISNDISIKDITMPKGSIFHKDEVYENSPVFTVKLKKQNPNTKGIKNIKLKLSYQGCSKQGLCYNPITKNYTLSIDTNKLNTQLSQTDFIASKMQNSSFFMIVLTFFISGFLLSLTPCVFPMIPIISGIIVSQGKNVTTYKAFLLSLTYVLSMAGAYTIAGILAGIFGSNLQAMLQNDYVIYAFSLTFVGLALSMFGLYELKLPDAISNKIGANSSRAGYIGVAIMGFLSALVVSPCVAAPLAGALVYIGQSGDALLGGIALFAMGIGMGVPLIAVGISAGRFMPKPGEWMNIVSVTFGFIMLGVAIWMMAKIVNENMINFLYALTLLGYAIYLALINKTKHILKILFALLILCASVFVLVDRVHFTNETSSITFKKIYSIKELDEILKNNKGKNILVDFSAKWCTSCKELDETTFKDKRVIKRFKDYVLVRVDLTNNTDQNKAISKKYGVFGPPVIIFFDKNGILDKSKTIVGYVDADTFLEKL